MMLEYDWGNPAAAAAAMLLFGEDSANQNNNNNHHQDHRDDMFNHYGQSLGMDFFQQPQPITAAALFSSSSTSSMNQCDHQRYGLGIPTAAPARIGLNLGVRTYFSSASPEEEMMVGRVSRRRTRTARCQAEGCGADLTHAKHYHRRHKVCEFHSKASIVITAGLSQRFCQQCSRFHVLAEFDQGKRSCRKRLADHNRRRRKSQDLTTSSSIINSQNNNNNNTSTQNDNNNNNILPSLEKPLITMTKLETSSSLTYVSSPPPALESISIPPMALGLGFGALPSGPVPAATAGLSASSSTGTASPPQSVSFLSQLGEFRSHEHRFPSWDEAEDGSCSIRGIFQCK